MPLPGRHAETISTVGTLNAELNATAREFQDTLVEENSTNMDQQTLRWVPK